jgi:hypothetical protein
MDSFVDFEAPLVSASDLSAPISCFVDEWDVPQSFWGNNSQIVPSYSPELAESKLDDSFSMLGDLLGTDARSWTSSPMERASTSSSSLSLPTPLSTGSLPPEEDETTELSSFDATPGSLAQTKTVARPAPAIASFERRLRTQDRPRPVKSSLKRVREEGDQEVKRVRLSEHVCSSSALARLEERLDRMMSRLDSFRSLNTVEIEYAESQVLSGHLLPLDIRILQRLAALRSVKSDWVKPEQVARMVRRTEMIERVHDGLKHLETCEAWYREVALFAQSLPEKRNNTESVRVVLSIGMALDYLSNGTRKKRNPYRQELVDHCEFVGQRMMDAVDQYKHCSRNLVGRHVLSGPINHTPTIFVSHPPLMSRKQLESMRLLDLYSHLIQMAETTLTLLKKMK